MENLTIVNRINIIDPEVNQKSSDDETNICKSVSENTLPETGTVD